MAYQTIRMAKNLREILVDLLKVIYLFVILFVIYQVLRMIIGGAWATENIIIAALGIIIAELFVIVGFLINQARSIGVLEERIINIDNSLRSLGSDFRQHLADIHKK